jgi:hypothetical protein
MAESELSTMEPSDGEGFSPCVAYCGCSWLLMAVWVICAIATITTIIAALIAYCSNCSILMFDPFPLPLIRVLSSPISGKHFRKRSNLRLRLAARTAGVGMFGRLGTL